MSTTETSLGGYGLSAAESSLGQALAVIHCVLPHLNESDYAVRVQAALRHAAGFIEAARKAHAQDTGLPVTANAQETVEAETVAVIAAAISVLLGTAYKVVAVQPLVVPPPHLNVWAFEGRTQLFMSHKVR